jgi:hypothetical protein
MPVPLITNVDSNSSDSDNVDSNSSSGSNNNSNSSNSNDIDSNSNNSSSSSSDNVEKTDRLPDIAVSLEQLLVRITQTLKSDPEVWDIYAGRLLLTNLHTVLFTLFFITLTLTLTFTLSLTLTLTVSFSLRSLLIFFSLPHSLSLTHSHPPHSLSFFYISLQYVLAGLII